MKIVHLCLSSFYIDNYSYQENMLPKYHVKQGHEVTMVASLVSFDVQGKPCLIENEITRYDKDGYKVIRIDYKRPFYLFNKFVRIYNNTSEILEQEAPDLIFIHDFSFLDIRKVIKYLKKNKDVKVFVDCHTDYINSAKTWISKNIFHHLIWRFYGKLLSPYVEMFYGVTPLRCDFLKDAYKIDPKKIELLVMGIDDELIISKRRTTIRNKLLAQLGLNESDFIIISGGKIDANKNIHSVMHAVNDINKENVKLVLFGNVAPEMQEDFDALLKCRNIYYVNWLSSEEILDYFVFGDLIIFPGSHSVLWEQAVGAGTPSVFKYWEGMTHVDVGGNCKFLYKDTVEEIREVIEALVENNGEYVKMKTIALERGIKTFAYSDIARRSIKM